jgi:4-diphosphocytidyl-2-C-methyl-D-erythritol kinase
LDPGNRGADGGLLQRVPSPAKINLHLQVVGRREDGYHELRTIFQTLDLVDYLDIELTENPGVDLEVRGADLSSGPDNLVHRAAVACLERWGDQRQGVRILLDKQIPLGAGLGGGSSNAATTLMAMHRLLGVGAQAEPALWEMARELGADVPFFLVGGTALGVGRGDEVVALPDLAPRRLGLALPGQEISSREIFEGLPRMPRRPLAPSILSWMRNGVCWETRPEMWNELESSVLEKYPGLQAVRHALLESGAEEARLSGSGSALYAIYPVGETIPPRIVDLPDRCRFLSVATCPR